ncbi:Uncharacterised protein [Vibrio cholerae]|nr:Uncharacterised protein [Vibrio cholerae]
MIAAGRTQSRHWPHSAEYRYCPANGLVRFAVRGRGAYCASNLVHQQSPLVPTSFDSANAESPPENGSSVAAKCAGL